MDEVTLYRKNSLGIGVWKISRLPNENSTKAQILISHSSVEGGAWIPHVDNVVTNQSGRTLDQQVELQMKSRISRQKDKGYKETRDEALLGSTNQMGLVNPMLAQKIADVTLQQSDLVNAYVQRKYDGHRTLVTKQGGEMLAYTRRGKPVNTIPQILEDCDRWMQDGDTLDGELYTHGLRLQDISSAIKAQQASSANLTYVWYDMVDPTKNFAQRYRVMRDLNENCQCPQIHLCPTYEIAKMAEVYDFFKGFRKEGYEGAMLRLSIAGYEDAKRARQVLKVKERDDCEVTVRSMRPAAPGWAILTVQMESGKVFDISAPGSVTEKQYVMDHPDEFIGRKLTIEYANLTNDGIPFHAVAIRWHEEL